MYSAESLEQEKVNLDVKITQTVWLHRGNNDFITFDDELKKDKSNLNTVLEYFLDTGEYDHLPLLEQRKNDGSTQDIRVLFIDNTGINYIIEDDLKSVKIAGLNDLASLRDKLFLLRCIEEKI